MTMLVIHQGYGHLCREDEFVTAIVEHTPVDSKTAWLYQQRTWFDHVKLQEIPTLPADKREEIDSLVESEQVVRKMIESFSPLRRQKRKKVGAR